MFMYNSAIGTRLGVSYRKHLAVIPQAFSPFDLSDLSVWYKADAITGLSDGDPVTEWADSSGNANNLTSSANGTIDPTYLVSSIGGLPGISFPGTNGRSLQKTSTPPGVTTNFTVVIVGQITGGLDREFFEMGTNDRLRFSRDKVLWVTANNPTLAYTPIMSIPRYSVFSKAAGG